MEEKEKRALWEQGSDMLLGYCTGEIDKTYDIPILILRLHLKIKGVQPLRDVLRYIGVLSRKFYLECIDNIRP